MAFRSSASVGVDITEPYPNTYTAQGSAGHDLFATFASGGAELARNFIVEFPLLAHRYISRPQKFWWWGNADITQHTERNELARITKPANSLGSTSRIRTALSPWQNRFFDRGSV